MLPAWLAGDMSLGMIEADPFFSRTLARVEAAVTRSMREPLALSLEVLPVSVSSTQAHLHPVAV